jgi:hypothetical protein
MGSNICNYKKTWTNNELNPDKKQVGQEQVGQEQVGKVEELSTDLVAKGLPEELSDTPTQPQPIILSKRVAAEAKAAAAPRLLLEQSPKARPAMTRAKTTSELLRQSTSDQI